MYIYINIIEVLNQYLQFMNEYLSELESRAEQESSCVKLLFNLLPEKWATVHRSSD